MAKDDATKAAEKAEKAAKAAAAKAENAAKAEAEKAAKPKSVERLSVADAAGLGLAPAPVGCLWAVVPKFGSDPVLINNDHPLLG